MNGSVKLGYVLLVYVLLATLGGGVGMLILTRFAPDSSAWFIYAGLYGSFWLVIVGLAGCGGLLLRRLFGWRLSPRRNRSGLIFRQSLLLGSVMTLALLFQAFRLLNYYTAGALVVTAALFELYALTRSFHTVEAA